MNHDPELTKTEGMLFELMRDGVITSLLHRQLATGSDWACAVYHAPSVVTTFTSKVSALDAYMQAFGEVMARKLGGQEIYSPEAKRRRKKIGVES